MTVRVVPADELYNEFSSGTPDVSAYRRYMKMLYDKAQTADETPKHLLLLALHLLKSLLEGGFFHRFLLCEFDFLTEFLIVKEYSEEVHLQECNNIDEHIVIAQTCGVAIKQSEEHDRHDIHHDFHSLHTRSGC